MWYTRSMMDSPSATSAASTSDADARRSEACTAAALNGEDKRLAGLQALADKRHIDLAQAVLAWLLARSPVTVVIPGTTKIEHLEDDVAAGKVHFTKKEMDQMAQLG